MNNCTGIIYKISNDEYEVDINCGVLICSSGWGDEYEVKRIGNRFQIKLMLDDDIVFLSIVDDYTCKTWM